MDFPEHLKARNEDHYEDLLNEHVNLDNDDMSYDQMINCILIISYHLRIVRTVDELIYKIFDKVGYYSLIYENLQEHCPTLEQIMSNEHREGIQNAVDLMRIFSERQLRIYGL
jgi:hypothetical protein